MHIKLQRLCPPAVEAPEPVPDAVNLRRESDLSMDSRQLSPKSGSWLLFDADIQEEKNQQVVMIGMGAHIVLCYTVVL